MPPTTRVTTIARVVDAATHPYLLRAGFAERLP